MNLKKTVEAIVGKEVTIEYAMAFANAQFGVLSTYIKKEEKKQVEVLKTALQDNIDYHHFIGNDGVEVSNNEVLTTLYNTAKKGLKDANLSYLD